jgi:hypothetical protein
MAAADGSGVVRFVQRWDGGPARGDVRGSYTWEFEVAPHGRIGAYADFPPQLVR